MNPRASTTNAASPCLAPVPDGESAETTTLLLRHAERERIETSDVAGALQAPLTEQGRDDARALGALLPATSRVRLFYSPVPRCYDTARCIAEGLETAGGEAEIVGSRTFLAAAFARDGEKIVEAFSELGLKGFVKAWFAGKLDASIVEDGATAARTLLKELVDARGDRPRGLDIHVSHDIVVMSLLGLAWDMTGPVPWPGFLDGISLSFADSDKFALRYHGEEKSVPASAK